ncbi:MAG: hypothetical protein H6748_08545 [Spirochaetaceae bacterium]|nr:hypothetical protein [Spirochaetaceae bacterium]
MRLHSLLSRPRRRTVLTAPILSALLLSIGAPPAGALVTTLLSSEANVAGSLADADQSWTDSIQSLDLAPSISVGQSFSTNTSSNSFVVSSHAVSVGRLRMSTRSTAGAGGADSNGDAAHDFQIRFSIDEAASYELKNGNATGSFPVATASGSASASLVYELRREGAPTPVFVFAATSSGAAGVYRSGVISAGTYLWSAVASAVANGTAGGAQSAAAIGNVTLQLDPAPPPTVPSLQPIGIAVLLLVLGGVVFSRSARRGLA